MHNQHFEETLSFTFSIFQALFTMQKENFFLYTQHVIHSLLPKVVLHQERSPSHLPVEDLSNCLLVLILVSYLTSFIAVQIPSPASLSLSLILHTDLCPPRWGQNYRWLLHTNKRHNSITLSSRYGDIWFLQCFCIHFSDVLIQILNLLQKSLALLCKLLSVPAVLQK